jgi:hypothetical protein
MNSKDQKNPEQPYPYVTRVIEGTSWVYVYLREGALKPQSNEDEKDPWELEKGIDYEHIGTPNITPEMPAKECKRLFWMAVRASASISDTEEDVLRKVKWWNGKNNPPIPEKRVEELVRWEIKRRYPRLRKPK